MTLETLAKGVDVDPAPLLDAALSDEVAQIYEVNTEEAIERSVFGSPTYFIDGDMFYGQDRLEMVERALDIDVHAMCAAAVQAAAAPCGGRRAAGAGG